MKIDKYSGAALALPLIAFIHLTLSQIGIDPRAGAEVVTMKPTTALGFIFFGVQSFALRSYASTKLVAPYALLCSAHACLWGVLWAFGFLIFLGMTGANSQAFDLSSYDSTASGVPSIGTFLGFFLMQLFFLKLIRHNGSGGDHGLWASGPTALIAITALYGNLFGVPWLRWSIDGISTGVSPYTSILFLLGCFSTLWIREER